jgi:DNA-binding CsgD family transcriptional regulator
MDASHPINRLTEREKEALRAWLNHKSAKEIALDLGITHHAVEKRLKMARTKLGAASSREAARALAEAEGYDPTAAALPDLPSTAAVRAPWLHRTIFIGAFAMLTVTALALALAPAYQLAEPIEIEVDGNLERVFAHLDENRSGFLENPESPFVTAAFVDPAPIDELEVGAERKARLAERTDPKQIAEFYAAADTDGDGRVSLAEYTIWNKAHWAEMGIEVKTILKVLPAPES